MESLEALVTIVKDFAAHNFSSLNIQKFSYGWNTAVAPRCEVDGLVILFKDACKCNLWYWWKRDLMASQSMEENIRRPYKSFLHFGNLGAFQGDLCLLSTRSIIETCIMPTIFEEIVVCGGC